MKLKDSTIFYMEKSCIHHHKTLSVNKIVYYQITLLITNVDLGLGRLGLISTLPFT